MNVGNKKGFTLVELLAVIVVLAIVSSLTVISVNHVIKTGKDSVTNKQIELQRGLSNRS